MIVPARCCPSRGNKDEDGSEQLENMYDHNTREAALFQTQPMAQDTPKIGAGPQRERDRSMISDCQSFVVPSIPFVS